MISDKKWSCSDKNDLLVTQVATVIPDSVVPTMRWFKKSTKEEEDEHDVGYVDEDPVSGRGQILWVRGLTRLQQQVRVCIVAFPALDMFTYCIFPQLFGLDRCLHEFC